MVSWVKTFLASTAGKEIIKTIARQTFSVLILLGGLLYLGSQIQRFQVKERRRYEQMIDCYEQFSAQQKLDNQRLVDCYDKVIEAVADLERIIEKMDQ